MAAYTAPPPHLAELPGRPPVHGKVIPRRRNLLGAALALGGLALALASLFLPWLTTGTAATGSLTAMEITQTIDVRSVAPILFIGLVVIALLVTVTALTRLGILATAAAAVSLVVLASHVAFVAILHTSSGSPDPTLSGLPADASVAHGPYVAGLGFLLPLAGATWAALSAEDATARTAGGTLARNETPG